SFLPDVISALRGGHTGYFQDWVRQVAGPAMAPGTSSNVLGYLERTQPQQSIAARSGQSFGCCAGLWAQPDDDPDRA
ncbi:MAG TPA: hypothetical protein VJX48_00085, partial [Xanthobacteraceae bacterium]|nr:hypothetical protein [Xanthobacteraceae bacterium]